MTTEGSICDEMRAASADIWDGLYSHPFLRELADGSLPLEAFRFFLEQDNLFLVEYARCLAMGAAKSRDDTEFRRFTADLNQVLDDELPSNQDLLARVIEMGAEDRGGALGMAPATVAYTSYLQALAVRGGPMEITAALLPCAWSYVDIAERLAAEGVSTHPIYADWIGYLTLPATAQVVASMRQDIDLRASEADLTAGARRGLGEIFAMSARLEWGFWEMAYTLDQWPDLRTTP